MANQPPSSNNEKETRFGPGEGVPPGPPGWVKLFGVIALALLLLVLGVHLAGGGFRGHSMQMEHGERRP